MLIRHTFSLGDLVMAKAEAHPYWPARVQSCIKNGCYLVRFFGEKSETSVMPNMVMQFNPMNVDRLRKEKEVGNGKNYKEAIRLAQRVVEERMKGNFEFEEEALMGGKLQIRKTVNKFPASSYKESSLNRSSLSSSFDHSTSKIPPSREVKTLLDRLVKHCAEFTQTACDITPAFTQQDGKRLMIILDHISGMSLQEIVDKWVVERMILVLRAHQQWGATSYEPLFEQIKNRYSEISESLLSQNFPDLSIDSSRRERITNRVKQIRVDVDDSDHPLVFDCEAA